MRFPRVHRPTLIVAHVLFALASASLAESPATPDSTRQLDDRQIESSGIRKRTSKHLILVTDVPSSPEVDRLPQVFDAAVPQWAAYFGVDEQKTAHWQARAYLISDRRRFESLGLMPPGRADFINGISMGAELWLHDQPTAYYRRHLLLHEGTHVFMASFLGGCGPGWYMEGTAELFATHRLDEQTGALTLRIMPASREEVPMLGRIKLIRDAVAANKLRAFPAVMQIDNREQLGNEAYAWCWAAAKFLDAHPRYRDRFRALSKSVLDPKFNDMVRREYEADWPNLTAEWLAYITTLDHGYDFERMTIDFRPGKPTGAGVGESASTEDSAQAQIAADRGWQSTGVELQAGHMYRIVASGRYQIAVERNGDKARPWSCEPGGVTIEYPDGHPLGMLLGAVVPDMEITPTGPMSFAHPIALGLRATITPESTGKLYLRVNDSAAKLADNQGAVSITIVQATDAK